LNGNGAQLCKILVLAGEGPFEMVFCHLPGGQGNSTNVIPKKNRIRKKKKKRDKMREREGGKYTGIEMSE
jgi:hypothetical protein